jgi:hypothetical protein
VAGWGVLQDLEAGVEHCKERERPGAGRLGSAAAAATVHAVPRQPRPPNTHPSHTPPKGLAFTWGNGNYGKLGHKVQQDEFTPRQVEGFSKRILALPDGVVGGSLAGRGGEGRGDVGDGWRGKEPYCAARSGGRSAGSGCSSRLKDRRATHPRPCHYTLLQPPPPPRARLQVAAGSTTTWCMGTGPQLYGWGKLKASGDNTTYPQPMNDLSGWNVRGRRGCGAGGVRRERARHCAFGRPCVSIQRTPCLSSAEPRPGLPSHAPAAPQHGVRPQHLCRRRRAQRHHLGPGH